MFTKFQSGLLNKKKPYKHVRKYSYRQFVLSFDLNYMDFYLWGHVKLLMLQTFFIALRWSFLNKLSLLNVYVRHVIF